MAPQTHKPIMFAESTLTRRGQTTIPSEIRKALALDAHDKIRFTVQADHTVVLSRAMNDDEHEDPMIGHFLDFLERHAQEHPEGVEAVRAQHAERIRGLVEDVDVTLDAPLDDADE